jgi:hypothetical protein
VIPRTHPKLVVVAGNGVIPARFGGDGGPATKVAFDIPRSIAVDSKGSLYIADQGMNRVRRVDLCTGIISTLAGNGIEGYSGDGGPATQAAVNGPYDVAVDQAGNVYTYDAGHGAGHSRPDGHLREITTDGKIRTLDPAGNADPLEGFGVDAQGNVYTDRGMRLDTAGNATRFYGSAAKYPAALGEGVPAQQAGFYSPYDVVIDR